MSQLNVVCSTQLKLDPFSMKILFWGIFQPREGCQAIIDSKKLDSQRKRQDTPLTMLEITQIRMVKLGGSQPVC